ncbi:Isopenicillin N epimerase component 1 [Penicillium herquei]|nr:Isopenicillin N epimerase component 1 [Penicillium herquei]
MDLASTAATLAGGATVAAYLNGKFHLMKDLKVMATMVKSQKSTTRAIAKGEVNLWFNFLETAEKYPDTTAIWTRGGSYTFRDVQEQACQYGHYFLSQGVKKGDLVALYLQNRIEFILAWLGLWSIGCAPAAINFNLSGEPLVHCLKCSGAKLLLVDDDATCQANVEACRDTLTGELGMTPVLVDEAFRANARTFPSIPPPRELGLQMSGGFPGILLYTSGTTGMPKGTAFTMSRLYTTNTVRVLPVGDKPGPGGDRWYNCMPLYHGTAATVVITALLNGTGVALAPKFSVSNFWKDVRDSEATLFIYVGETARYLLSAPPSSFDGKHKVRGMWGNGLRPDVWEKFRERFNVAEIYEFFNSSEGVFSLLNVNFGPFTSGCVGHHGALTRAFLRNTYVPVAIDSESGEIIRDSKTGFAVRPSMEEGGEMLVKIPNEEAFQGYWNNEDATQKKYLRDVFVKGDLYYRSGDALRRTNDGRWYFVDRLGDTFRWKSENVSTAEVSEALGRYPGVIEANVYGVLVPGHEGRAGCAALQLSPEDKKNLDFAEVARFARSKLPRYAVPVFLRLVDNPVHIHNNKQNKAPLRQEGVDPALIGTKVPDGQADQIYWLPPGEDAYKPFGEKEWATLTEGKARL